jgi:hypothetical protein
LSNVIKITNPDSIEKLALQYPNVTYLDVNQWAASKGSLSTDLHIGDGVHLNEKGNWMWIKQLRTLF